MSNSSDKFSSPTSIYVGTSNPNKLVSREEAAAFLGIKCQTLAVWAATKRYPLPVVKIGSRARYWLHDLIAFAEKRTSMMSEGNADDAA